MPVETLKVSFRPQSFFKINPAMDVPEAAPVAIRDLRLR
jgi:Cu2+-containing amine oxidase